MTTLMTIGTMTTGMVPTLPVLLLLLVRKTRELQAAQNVKIMPVRALGTKKGTALP